MTDRAGKRVASEGQKGKGCMGQGARGRGRRKKAVRVGVHGAATPPGRSQEKGGGLCSGPEVVGGPGLGRRAVLYEKRGGKGGAGRAEETPVWQGQGERKEGGGTRESMVVVLMVIMTAGAVCVCVGAESVAAEALVKTVIGWQHGRESGGFVGGGVVPSLASASGRAILPWSPAVLIRRRSLSVFSLSVSQSPPCSRRTTTAVMSSTTPSSSTHQRSNASSTICFI